MALKALLTKAEYKKLNEAIQEHYKEEGDNYILDTDQTDLKLKLNEFRDNNVKLLKEQKELLIQAEKFKGVDLEKYNAAQAKLLELEDQQLIDEGKMDELLEVRTERMKKDYENKYTALETRNVELESQATNSEQKLHLKMVEAKIAYAVGEVGTVRKGAMPDILSRAAKIWKLDKDLELVAMEGDQVVIGTGGKENLTPKEYATQLLQDAPFFFEGSGGGNSDGNDDNKGSGGGKTVLASDKLSFGKNIEEIAKGNIQVTI